jgi:hypothetical protein
MMDLCHESSSTLASHATDSAMLLLQLCTRVECAMLSYVRGVELGPMATKRNVVKARSRP